VAEAASFLRLASLAVFHGLLLYGVFEHNWLALSVAAYLRDWPLAEIIALIVTPYLMTLTVRNHERPFWQRALWLPLTLVIMGGIGGAVRFLRATWFYVLTCIPVVLVEYTRSQAELGCARSMARGVVLIALAVVFEDRPYRWPIGTVVGKWMTPEARYLANGMAFATAYFALTAGVEALIWRARRKAAAATA
jgi:hypothetical protein